MSKHISGRGASVVVLAHMKRRIKWWRRDDVRILGCVGAIAAVEFAIWWWSYV